jgi:hypothetical protein
MIFLYVLTATFLIFLMNTDRYDSDYKDLDLAQADPALCETNCNGEARCKAWTYVRAGIQGPNARC